MHNERALAAIGGQMIPLDEEQLAEIVGGLGPFGKILTEFATIFWDCLKTGIDDVIDAAKEGYDDNRG
jgi:hypothetical protein